jgi:hypothetical protein
MRASAGAEGAASAFSRFYRNAFSRGETQKRPLLRPLRPDRRFRMSFSGDERQFTPELAGGVLGVAATSTGGRA